MPGIAGILHTDGSPIDESAVEWLTNKTTAFGGTVAVLGRPGQICVAALAANQLGPTCACALRNRSISEASTRHRGDTNGNGAYEADLWVICYGRIDNREDLTDALCAAGWKAHEAWDLPAAEAVLAAYLRYGMDSPDKVIGDYAFVVWDGQAKQFFAARSPHNAPKLYYTLVKGRLRFSSDPLPLLEDPMVSDKLNREYMTMFVLKGERNWDRTPYENVRQIPRGWFLKVLDGRLTTNWFWRLPKPCTLRYKREEDYQAHLKHLYRLAVGARMRGAGSGPVSIALSRGVDSGSIAATALELIRDGTIACPGGVQGITVIFPDYPGADESQDAGVIAANMGLPHRIIPGNTSPCDIRPLSVRLPEPSSCTLLYGLFWEPLREECLRSDSHILLTGSGGGILFEVHTRALSTFIRKRRFLIFFRWYLECVKAGYSPRGLLQETIGQLTSKEFEIYASSKDLLMRILDATSNPFIQDIQNKQPVRSESAMFSHHFLQYQCRNIVEIGDTDRTYSCLYEPCGIEMSHPLWDQRIVEFTWSLPIEMKLPIPFNKPLERKTFCNFIPKDTKPNGIFNDIYINHVTYSYNILQDLLSTNADHLDDAINAKEMHEVFLKLRINNNVLYFGKLAIAAIWVLCQHQTAKQDFFTA